MIVTHFADHTHDDDIHEDPPVEKASGSYIVVVRPFGKFGQIDYYRFDTPQQALHFSERVGSMDIYHEVDDQGDWYVYDFETNQFVYP